MHLSTLQKKMLLKMRWERFPVARFELRNDREEDLAMTALDNVWIQRPEDSMETVKERSAALRELEEAGFIQIHFDAPAVVAGDHTIYYKSELYALLCKTALEAAQMPDNLFNLPCLCKGYAAPTLQGRRAVRKLLARRRMERLSR
ncbi:hypothetical protein [Clostridium sp. D33t1_170424_F3]|uniref:hypothetical protein n=1 Tax=Clostridium sp. D33t1_170424_F3 TaxID=2787099 RepID=UPI0018A9AAE6|nr:hypothetical protein [Clostridium sp. D33t1_170424_F3]